MPAPAISFRSRLRLDSLGVVLSAACAVHCLAGLLLVTVLGLGGGLLLDPRIHEIGLALAIGIGALGLGFGAMRHRRFGALATGACGLALMAVALAAPHGPAEAMLTIAGVVLVATAHVWNLRHHA